jgi:hypothetical protein
MTLTDRVEIPTLNLIVNTLQIKNKPYPKT